MRVVRISTSSNESGWGRQASFPRNNEGKAAGAGAVKWEVGVDGAAEDENKGCVSDEMGSDTEKAEDSLPGEERPFSHQVEAFIHRQRGARKC